MAVNQLQISSKNLFTHSYNKVKKWSINEPAESENYFIRVCARRCRNRGMSSISIAAILILFVNYYKKKLQTQHLFQSHCIITYLCFIQIKYV